MQTSRDGGTTWSELRETDIPNAPGFTQALRLSDGRIAITGNQESTRATLYLAIYDPFEVTTSVYSILSSVSTTPTYAGTYKGGGAAYQDMVQVGNELYVSYSLQKESVGFSRVTIPS